MSFIDMITPKETEEVKPGLFIQKKLGKYRHIHPAAWNGKIIWKNFIFGGSYKHLLWFIIILFIVFGYVNDVGEYKNFYEDVRGDPIGYCAKVDEALTKPVCTIELQEQGLCTIASEFDASDSEVVLNGDPNPI